MDTTVIPDPEELRSFYERYIAAFNAGDEPAFFDCFNLPISVLRLASGEGGDATGAIRTAVEADELWPTLPPQWTHSTIDDIRVVADATSFVPHDGWLERSPRRTALEVTVTRWSGDSAYEQYHVLYLLTTEDGHLGIKAMVPLAMARPAG